MKIKNLDSKYKEIIESLKYNKKDIIYNTPTIIEYNQRIFKISTNDFFEKLEAKWKWKYFRRIKDKPKDAKQFCNSTIKGIKNIISDEYKFYLNMSI